MQFTIMYRAVSGIEIRENVEIRDRPMKNVARMKMGNERILANNYAANQVRKHVNLAGVVSVVKSGPVQKEEQPE